MAVHGYLEKVLSDDEHVLRIVHKHWLVLLGQIFWSLVLIVVIVAAAGAAQFLMPALPFAAFGYLAVLLPIPFIWWNYLVWSNHAYVLTSWRIIQMSGVFNKRVVDSSLEKVNDVVTSQPFLGRIFGYGDIEILTAAEEGVNDLKTISNPLGFKVSMLEAKEALEVRHGGGG
ncbi:MAG: PH domain-containing protein [Caulobacteraceae bacterium]